MHSVTYTTTDVSWESRLSDDASPEQPRPHDSARASGRPLPGWTAARLRATLARADRPMRARALARELGVPSAAVTAELRRLQDLGLVTSHDRRWTVTSKAAAAADDAIRPRKTA